MKRFVGIGGVGLLLIEVAITNSIAAVIERDWKTPGDGLLTLDTVNQREWLDLSQTVLDTRFPGSNPNPSVALELRYQYVVGQTAPGGIFDGFTVAKSDDVIALALSAGIDTSTNDFVTNSLSASSLGQLLSLTRTTMLGSEFAIGLLDEVIDNIPPRLGAGVYVDVVSGPSGFAGIRFTTGYTQFINSPFETPSPPGVFLYRIVPEPATFISLIISVVSSALWMRGGAR